MFGLVSSVLVLAMLSTFLMFQFVRKTETARIETLGLYSDLFLDDVNAVIAEITKFAEAFKGDKITHGVKKLGIDGDSEDFEDESDMGIEDVYELDEEEGNDLGFFPDIDIEAKEYEEQRRRH